MLVNTIVSALVASVFSLVVSETIRRRSRWESYAGKLWDERLRIYSKVILKAWDAYDAAKRHAELPDYDEDEKQAKWRAYAESMRDLYNLDAERSILSSGEFNAAYQAFLSTIMRLIHGPSESQYKLQLTDEAVRQRDVLVNVARQNLGVEKLSGETGKLLGERRSEERAHLE